MALDYFDARYQPHPVHGRWDSEAGRKHYYLHLHTECGTEKLQDENRLTELMVMQKN